MKLLNTATVLFFLVPFLVTAQPSGIPLNAPSYSILERMEVLYGLNSPGHSAIKPFSRQDAASVFVDLDTHLVALPGKETSYQQYLLDDNSEWTDLARVSRKPILHYFYRSPATFYEVNVPHFKLRVNPILHIATGLEQDRSGMLFINQRGIDVRGVVDEKLFFFTSLLETQWQAPSYVEEWEKAYQALPGAGFYKRYESRVLDIRDGYDFNIANAGIGIQATQHVGLQLGHGQHFIGNGYRSLLLSNFGTYAFYLKLSARIWRLHYQTLFLELHPVSQKQVPGNTLVPKKYAAIHYLSYKVTPRLTLGFFEATIFNRSRQFELQYLNPVILYRSVEGLIGSPDNILVGLNANWDIFHRIRLYGQFLLDEFLFRELIKPEQKGWWGNKYGFQAGAQYFNMLGVDRLDLRLEFNTVRPYTYSHFDSLNAYTHYNQALAHPLGANFREMMAILRYQPLPRLTFQARIIDVRSGENSDQENWGASPLRSYTSRVQDYDVRTGQGITSNMVIAGLDIEYAVRHNLMLDVRLFYRNKKSQDTSRSGSTTLITAGIRLNAWPAQLDF